MPDDKRPGRSRSCRLGLLAAVLLAVWAPDAAQAQETDSAANYRVTFTGTWTADKITQSSLPGGAHFTTLIGATHNSQVTFWQVGGMATAGVELVAELGGISTFTSEINASSQVGRRLEFGSSFIGATSQVSTNFQATKSHPLVTLLSMVAPSPDWFVGVSGLSLLDGSNQWRTSLSVDLHPYDAGTENGSGFSLSNTATSPQGTITSIRNTAPFNGQPLARLTFTRVVPTASFARASSSAGEGAGTRNVAVSLSSAPPSTIRLSYAVSGSATPGADYAALPGAVSVSSGATSVNIPVRITDDAADEAAETLVLTLTGGSGYTVGSRSAHTLTITDNDDPLPTASFASASSSAGEGAGTRNVAVSLSPAPSSGIRLRYSVSGMARAGADYAALSGTVSVSGGATSVNIPVAIIDDGDDEGAEAVVLTLASGSGYVVGSPNVHMLTITDNDDPPPNTPPNTPAVSVAGDAAAVTEGGTARFTLTASPAPSASLSVRVNVAQTGRFADPAQTGTRMVTVGTGGTATLTVPTVNDSADEPNGAIMVTVLGGNGYSPHDANAVASVMVRDDDDPPPPPPPPEVAGGLEPRALAAGAALSLDLSDAFRAPGGGALEYAAVSSDPAVAAASVDGATLTVRGLAPGAAEIRITATDRRGRSASQRLAVTVAAPAAAWYLPPASHPFLRGFVRVVNRADAPAAVAVTPTDDAGRQYAPLTLRLGAREAKHFNSDDLEAGNPAKGLDGAAGPGTGGWRLAFAGADAGALPLLRAADGFATAMAATAPRGPGGALRLLFFNPAGNTDQVSRLRLVNPTAAEARATVTGTDDAGASPGAPVRLTLPPGAACEVDAAALESGRGLDCGAPQAGLGDGRGKWRLAIAADAPLVAMGLLSSPGGHLANLSAELPADDAGVRRAPLFPAASDPLGRRGFVRLANASDRAGAVTLRAFDDAGRAYGPLTLGLGAREAKHLNSEDLELGNPAKGLDGAAGAGAGDWRLELSADIDLRAGAYVRHAGGFVTAMGAVAPSADGVHRVATLNPGSNTRQRGRLRLVNRGPAAASATVEGTDDAGASPGTAVAVRVPARGAVELTAARLESGEADAVDSGALGDGAGKWRLRVAADADLAVMSLVEDPAGRLANWSAADPAGNAPPPAPPAPPAP